MSNVFTLDSLNDELERQYAPFVFQAGRDKFVLRQVLRLPKSERDVVFLKLQELDQHQESKDTNAMEEVLWFILETVTDAGKGDKLVDLLEGDLAKGMVLLQKWMESTQAGEAKDSPN
jgi:hypothetical protein